LSDGSIDHLLSKRSGFESEQLVQRRVQHGSSVLPSGGEGSKTLAL
jgi:hypothetical protein